MTEELTVDAAMTQRFELVEQIAIIQGRHKNELAPLLEVANLCEQFIKDEMNKSNMQQLKTAAGHMAYFTSKDSVKVGDWDQTLAFIKENQAYYLLNQAVNKTSVKEFIEANKVPPPGVEYSSFKDLAWRRGKGV